MATYLVTGATGFLGAHLVDALLAAGHQVIALVRQPHPQLTQKGVHTVLGDILEVESVRAALRTLSAPCDGLFHAAGKVSRDPSDTLAMTRINHHGTRNMLKAAKEAGIPRVIHMSTSGTIAIREKPSPLPNETSPTPLKLLGQLPYYRSKLYAEEDALRMNTPDFAVVSLNPSLLLGPGDITGASTKEVRLFLEEKIPALPPGGLSFVDVRDVAEIAVRAIDKARPGQRYLLGGANMTFADFFGRLERVSGIKAPSLPMPKDALLSDLSNRLFKRASEAFGHKIHVLDSEIDQARYFWYLDDTRAREELGFKSREPMQTLYDTVQDLRTRGIVWPVDDTPSPDTNAWQDDLLSASWLRQLQGKATP